MEKLSRSKNKKKFSDKARKENFNLNNILTIIKQFLFLGYEGEVVKNKLIGGRKYGKK